MKMMFKLIIGIGLCLTLCIGCSKENKETDNVINLRMSVFGAKQESDLANALARRFEKKFPNVRVSVEPVAGAGYDAKLIMQSAAGTLPDVVFLTDTLVPPFIEYKVVRDLNEFNKIDKAFDLSDIYPQMQQTGMGKDGGLYMMPRELGVVVLFYNRTLFRRAGLSDPKPDWNYYDLLRIAKKLTLRDKSGRITQYGFLAPYSWAAMYASWVAANGGSVISPDGVSTLSSPETLRALHTLTDLVTNEKVAMPPNQSLTAPGIDPFAAGKVAMIVNVFPQVPQFRATMGKFDWDVQMLPIGKVKRVINMGSAGYGISSTTKHPRESWEFVKFIISKEGQRVMAGTGSGIPVLMSLANDSCWRKPGLRPRNVDAFIKSVKYGMGWTTIMPFTKAEVSDAVSEAFEKVFTDQESVESAFTAADKKINRILDTESKQ